MLLTTVVRRLGVQALAYVSSALGKDLRPV